MSDGTPFSRLLSGLREEAQMTLRVVAEKLNVTPSCVSDWERGRRNPPESREVLEAMARVFTNTEEAFRGLLQKLTTSVYQARESTVVPTKTREQAELMFVLNRKLESKQLDDDAIKNLIREIEKIGVRD